MHTQFISYLQDNRDQIIENWLTEVEVPPPNGAELNNLEHGVVPIAYLKTAFVDILSILENGKRLSFKPAYALELEQFLGLSCNCRKTCSGGRVCIELYVSAIKAFRSVIDESWDVSEEFDDMDRRLYLEIINKALSQYFSEEISCCSLKKLRTDCPFLDADQPFLNAQ